MSVRLGIRYRSRHEFDEIVEQVVRIVRPWGGLGMILHAEHRMVAVAEALERLSFRLRWVISTSFGLSESGSTAKP